MQGKSISITLRMIACGLACALLAGCFFIPGRFHSELDIRRDGRFSYSYTGEFVFLYPQERPSEAWDDSMAECFNDENAELRPCSSVEITTKRQAYEKSVEQGKEAGEDLQKLTGYDPVDPEANKRMAAELMQYPGWKRVDYMGDGTFYVEYQVDGMLDRDFAFPVVPQVQMAMPFVNIARNKAGAVTVSASGLASQQMRRLLLGQTNKLDDDDISSAGKLSILNRTNGKLTITTDAEITATNGQTSQSGGLQRVEWIIERKTSNSPNIQLQMEP